MTGRIVAASDALKAHSTLGAAGWHLADMPDGPKPAGTVALYERAGKRAWLIRSKGSFELREVPHGKA
ncbi:MAG: hypothetical protein JXR96_04915 [Deltaproteobacteria bacterium]|nr:hypothetical protein [Deltaproteobacteria bacterium]